MKKKIETPKNISVQIPAELHTDLKIAAVRRGQTVAEFVERAIHLSVHPAGPVVVTQIHGGQIGAFAAQLTNQGDIAQQVQAAQVQGLQNQWAQQLTNSGAGQSGNIWGGQMLGGANGIITSGTAPKPELVEVTDEELFQDFGIADDDTHKS
jgi:hypothetical protein